MKLIETLLHKIETAKDLDFGAIFNQSIELFKKVWVQGLVMTILTIAFLIPFYVLMYLPLIGMGFMEPEMLESKDFNIAVLLPFYFFALLFAFFAMVIGFAFKAAFIRICRIKDLGEGSKEDYFYYFKKPYLGKVIYLSLISFAIAIVAMLLCVLPLFYVLVPLNLMVVVFAFNPDLKPQEIVKAAFKLGNKKWLITFGLIIVSSFLAQMVGFLMCFVGVLITASFTAIPLYFVYKEAVGLENDYLVK